MSAEHNPYSAPKVPVAEVDTTETRVRPWSVRIAAILIAINVALGAIEWSTYLSMVESGAVSGLFLVQQLAKWALLAVIGYQVWRGRNWARVAFLVWSAWALISLLMLIWPYVREAAQYMLDATFLIRISIPVVIDLAASWLLFFPGREWFARRSP